jgi:hypothetical protein
VSHEEESEEPMTEAVPIYIGDFPADVRASAMKFSAYAQPNPRPDGEVDWLSLAHDIGIPQEHLDLIVARVSGLF